MTDDNNNEKAPTPEELYPGHTPEWYEQAEVGIHRYLETIIRIAERLQSEGTTVKDLKDFEE